ncbi:retrovirus-related pol polyprotein from transposon TNT 1-94 [Tanacetum coccineum]
MMNELVRNQYDVTNHQVNIQFLLQLQPEWKRSQQYATRNRGKAIVNSPTSTYDQEPEMVAEDDEMSKDKEIDKLVSLISQSFKKIYKPTNNNLRTSSNTSRANQDNSLRINKGTGYDNQRVVNVVGARENKPKRAKDASYHKEKMLLCKQEEAGFKLNADQADWRDDTDDEPEDQELEAHYLYMAQIQEVTPDAADNSGPIFDAEPLQKVQDNDDNYNVFAIESEHPEQPESVNDTYPVEQDEHNIIIDSLDMRYDREQDDQDDNDLARERELLASLIEKLKCEIDDNKNHNKFLESSNKDLVDKSKDEIKDFKTKNKSLESSNNHFKKANNELSKTNQLMFKDLKKFQAELDRFHDVNYTSKVAIDCAKAKGDLMSYKMESEKSFNEYTRKINDLNQMISEMKKELFAHQETISIIFVKPEFLKKAQRANPRLYDIGCYNDNLALMLAPESDEMIRLAQESRSKLIVKCERLEKELSKRTDNVNNKSFNELSKRFSELEQHSINLELTLQQSQKQLNNDKVWKQKESNSFRELNVEYFEIQDLKAQLQDKDIAIRAIPTTSVSRLQLKSNQLEDRVMHNNSQGKKTKQSIVVPISTREPMRNVNQSVATPLKKTVASESTNQKPRSTTRKQYEHLVEIILFIFDSRCSKHMTGNLKLLSNFMEQFLGTMKFGNDQIAPILGYGDLVQGNGNDLLTGSRGTYLYSITLQDTSTPNPICLMAKATSSQAWLWHRRLSHLNFDTINLPLKYDIVTGLPKLKFVKDHLFSSCELGKTKYHVSSDPVPQCPTTALEHASLSPGPQSQENVPHSAETVTTLNELNLLFSLMFDELLNGTTPVVSKSSAVTATDAPNQRQEQNTTPSASTTVAADIPPLNIQTTPETTDQAPTVTAIENINQAETDKENEQVEEDEFINIFSTPV